jgi:protein-glutamine gamma-glutamyltransferase
VAAKDWTRYQFRWGLGQLLALLALFAVFKMGVAGSWLVGAAGLLVALMTLRPQWLGRFQSPLTRYGPKLILVAIVADFVLSAGEVVPPLIRTLSLLLTYRALEFRHPRQDRQLVLVALLLLLMTGTLTADLFFALELFLFVPIALFLLAVAVADDRGPKFLESYREPWRDFTWRSWFRRNRRRVDRRILVFAASLYAFFGAATMLLFWSLPRFEFGHQLPFLQLNSPKSLTGFSETVAFGAVIEIQQDFSVAMRVDAPSSAASERPYWRMMVLDEYFGRGFRQSESARDAVWTVNDSRMVVPGRQPREEASLWTHFLEGGISRQLPVPGGFGEMRFTSRQNLRYNNAVGTIALRETPANMLVFRLHPVELREDWPASLADQSLREAAGPILVAKDGTLPPYPLSTLALPDETGMADFLGGAVGAILARGGGHESVDDFAASAIAWLQAGRGYSLEVTLGTSSHPLVEWMRGGEAGHCELYAGSLTLLARQAGIPARLVTGFHGGVWNGFEDYFMVRNADAHAWVELFDAEAGLWRRFDPTPGNSRIVSNAAGDTIRRIADPRPIDATWGAYLDSLRVLWYRKVVNFDQADQEAMVAAARSALVAWAAALRETAGETWAALGEVLRAPLQWRSYRGLAPALFALLVALILIWLGRRLSWAWSGRPRLSPERRTRRRAERWLARLAAGTRPGSAGGREEVIGRLRLLRYGDPATWETPAGTFKAARGVLRARRADTTSHDSKA